MKHALSARFVAMMLATCSGCEGNDASSSTGGSHANEAAGGGRSGAAGKHDAGDPDAGGGGKSGPDASMESMPDQMGGDAGVDGGTVEVARVELPPGSRELNNVVNFVDEAAADELEAALTGQAPVHVALRADVTINANLFLAHYTEAYDFLFVFTDHSVASTTVARFSAVNRAAAPGGTSEIEIAPGGYTTTGRLRGLIAVQWRDKVGPPLSHEIMHYWGAHLDTSFGFSAALDGDYASHWGYSSVHGQIGGFDAASLRCETPSGALPPNCTALGSGRFRYVMSWFFPNSNPSVSYAPLELYLMGLIPSSEVPSPIQVLQDAAEVPDSRDSISWTVMVEAKGIRQVAMSDIIARHGTIAPLPEDERHFSAAFVVVSKEPASDRVMTDVAEWAAAFGNRGTSGVVTPFETLNGGRATLDTELGPRRAIDEPPPPPRERFVCDLIAQDCPRPELACYDFSPHFCALSGAVALDQPCDRPYQCAPGLDCYSGPSDPNAYVCRPYCDPDDDTSSAACQTLCAGSKIVVNDGAGTTLGAICPAP
jgi:hypothetical protein